MTAPTLISPEVTTDLSGRVCTIRNRALARGVLAALIGIALIGGAWLAGVMLAGPYLADSLLVEGLVAGAVVVAGVALAVSLSRALGCGHCHTPGCTCT
jgi:hypothetical protein